MPIEVDVVHLDTYVKAKVIEKIPCIPLKVLLDSISELNPTTWVSSVSLRDSHHMNRSFPLSAHLSFELQLQRSQSYIHAVIAIKIPPNIPDTAQKKDPLRSSTCRGKKSTELTQNVAMTSTISQDSAEASSGTAANHHPFHGNLVKGPSRRRTSNRAQLCGQSYTISRERLSFVT
ncbi:hypothetical protein F9C07_2105925 [Aspergillus flavus]|uniref:Uncharacterized protein n=1 Tax=Aspergillus flavus (strain ATCC 200026 / FGSC A1120 / IAM 13836 / NRRL 3357 / JCM 12722 / SRRC 167) TaxID=332952 RepID=A0A7U2MTI0_ASPFN|nr:hypothetical protein F9C07_2105925 [Aspergillus flavus]